MGRILWVFLFVLCACYGSDEIDEKFAEQMKADVEYLQEQLPSYEELWEVVYPLAVTLKEHERDFEKCFKSELDTPFKVYGDGFSALSFLSDSKIISEYYMQKYFNQQLEYLVVRYGRGRSFFTVLLTEKGVRESRTEVSIDALCRNAKIRNLVIEDSIEDIYKLLCFFNKSEDSSRYFYRIISELETRDARCRFIQNCLAYLIQRYYFDRGWVTRGLEFCGVWKSRTRVCIDVLLEIAKGLNFIVTGDFLSALKKVDEKDVDEIVSYFMGIPGSAAILPPMHPTNDRPMASEYTPTIGSDLDGSASMGTDFVPTYVLNSQEYEGSSDEEDSHSN